jgi:DNA-binding PadR family transcriptional regulator
MTDISNAVRGLQRPDMDSNPGHPGSLPKAELLILTSLSTGSKHGYAMMDDLRRSYGTRLGPGTLYTAISRLEARGLIEPVPSDNRRQPYRLTDAGRDALYLHLTELQRFAASGLDRLATS